MVGRDSTREGPATSSLATYAEPMGIPITFSYPSDWFARSVSSSADGLSSGAAISNVEAAVPSSDPGPMPDASPPLDYVRVTIFASMGSMTPIIADSDLPLSMDNAKVAPGGENVKMLDAQVAGVPLVIEVSAGPNASKADIAAADAIVASIRPTTATTPSQSVGTPSPSGETSHVNWVTYRLPAEGLTIQAPSAWHLIEDPLPSLSRPHALIEMSSYFAPLDPNSGCVAPTNAIKQLPDNQMVFWLVETGSGATGLPPRPDPFELQNLGGYDCITRSAYLTPFADQGRYFELFAVFGSNASDTLRKDVIDSLSSLQVDPAGGTGPGSSAAGSWLEPPTFAPAAGWQTLSSSQDGSSLSPQGAPMTWASNTSFDQADLDKLDRGNLTGEFWPEHTINALSGDQVVLVVSFDQAGYSAPIDGDYPTSKLPLDIHDATGPVEGGRQSVLWTAVNGQFVTVRFFYGSDVPTDAQLAAAQTELDNLKVPALPPAG
jgi:hypothetical protein